MAQIDFLAEPRNGADNTIELLLAKLQNIKIKLYQEANHSMPHIHIDYGKQHHAASFSIQTGERIEGDLPKKYDETVNSWIADHRTHVLEVWNLMQAGINPHPLIAELYKNA